MPILINHQRHYPTFTQQELDKEIWVKYDDFLFISNLGRGKLTELGQDFDMRLGKSEWSRVVYKNDIEETQFKYDTNYKPYNKTIYAKLAVVRGFLKPDYKPKTIHYNIKVIHRDGNHRNNRATNLVLVKRRY